MKSIIKAASAAAKRLKEAEAEDAAERAIRDAASGRDHARTANIQHYRTGESK